MNREVFKVQRPLATTDAGLPLLAYNKSRTVTLLIRDDEDLLALFGEKVKIYVEGTPRTDLSTLDNVEVMDDKNW